MTILWEKGYNSFVCSFAKSGRRCPKEEQIMGLFEKIFGTYSQRELKNIRPIVDRVLAL